MPSGVQRAPVTRTLGGVFSFLREPSAAEITWMPIVLRSVTERRRFALKSMNTPPSSSNGFEKIVIGTGPSPISSRNHCLVGARVAERDVHLARREHGRGQFRWRLHVAFEVDDLVGPAGAR